MPVAPRAYVRLPHHSCLGGTDVKVSPSKPTVETMYSGFQDLLSLGMTGNSRGQGVDAHGTDLVGATQASRLPVTPGSQGWMPRLQAHPWGCSRSPCVCWTLCRHHVPRDPERPKRRHCRKAHSPAAKTRFSEVRSLSRGTQAAERC